MLLLRSIWTRTTASAASLRLPEYRPRRQAGRQPKAQNSLRWPPPAPGFGGLGPVGARGRLGGPEITLDITSCSLLVAARRPASGLRLNLKAQRLHTGGLHKLHCPAGLDSTWDITFGTLVVAARRPASAEGPVAAREELPEA